MDRTVNVLPLAEYPRPGIRDRLRFRSRPTQTVGIDIDVDAVRAAFVDWSGGRPRLVCVETVPLPEGTCTDEYVTEHIALATAFVELRARLVARGCTPYVRTVLGVRGSRVIVKHIELPTMLDSELDEAMAWEMEQYIPFDIRDVYLDWERVPELEVLRSGQMSIVLVAAKRAAVDDLVGTLRASGFAVAAVEPVAWGLRRIAHAHGERARRVVVHVGVAVSTVSVTDGVRLDFTRDMAVGLQFLAERIARECSVSDGDAMAACMRALALDGNGSVDAGDLRPDTPIALALHRAAGDLASDVRRTLDFYGATTPGVELATIELLGIGAQLPALAGAIAERSKLEVRTLDVVRAFPTATSVPADAALAVGFALRNDWEALDHRARHAQQDARARERETRENVVAIARAHERRARGAANDARISLARRYTPSDRALARCCETLAFLLGEDIRILDALEAMTTDARAVPRRFRRTLVRIREVIETGATFAEALGQIVACPPVVVRAIESGERRRVLAETLLVCAQYLRTNQRRTFLDPELAARIRAAR